MDCLDNPGFQRDSIMMALLHRHRAVVQDAINIATGQLKFVTVQATAAIICGPRRLARE